MAAAGVSLDQARSYLSSNASLLSALGLKSSQTDVPLFNDLRFLGLGEHNVNFAFSAGDSRYVLRVNVSKQVFHDDQVGYEFAALQALESSGCVPRPIYLDNGATALGEGVIVEGFCEGDQLDFDALVPGDLTCVMDTLANVHAVRVTAGCTLFRPADPLRELFNECVDRFKVYRASAYEDARITRWAERFIAHAQAALDAAGTPQDATHVINTETLASHFLLRRDGEGRAISASFVDWERPIIGEVAQDVAYFVSPTSTFWDSEYLMRKDEALELVEEYWRAVNGRFDRADFDARFAAWRAMTALRSTTWCCKALLTYGAGSQSPGHTTSKTAKKLPVYLSDDFMALVFEECF